MGCVRKRGKSWNAQVRIAGWRSFTKSFKSKSDAVCWVQQTEHQLKNTSLPLVDVADTTLRELLQTYAKEVSSHLEGSKIETYKLNLYSKYPIAENKRINFNQRQIPLVGASLWAAKRAKANKILRVLMPSPDTHQLKALMPTQHQQQSTNG